MFYGLCTGAIEVALDPVPGMMAERTVGLVSLLREGSIELVMAQGSLELCEPDRGSWREGERSRGSQADRDAAPRPRRADPTRGFG